MPKMRFRNHQIDYHHKDHYLSGNHRKGAKQKERKAKEKDRERGERRMWRENEKNTDKTTYKEKETDTGGRRAERNRQREREKERQRGNILSLGATNHFLSYSIRSIQPHHDLMITVYIGREWGLKLDHTAVLLLLRVWYKIASPCTLIPRLNAHNKIKIMLNVWLVILIGIIKNKWGRFFHGRRANA